ncbi:hypothetical protein BAE44_0007969 [Dichanthelium oligosanthes]|uniref:F-box domain-containing protein n=1 Tax=Dichanthelium oligosanthes TaxID=888268 RepID=A0A1E5W0Z1_9POAL|nr:hypothetical protein BAE44_0007969 [Dichanthelium oligosanthes]
MNAASAVEARQRPPPCLPFAVPVAWLLSPTTDAPCLRVARQLRERKNGSGAEFWPRVGDERGRAREAGENSDSEFQTADLNFAPVRMTAEMPSPALLPPDILVCIFSALQVPDLVRAGSVCSSWLSAYTSVCNLGLHWPQQTPCLFYTSGSTGDGAAGLYSLEEKKAYTLRLPDPPIRSRNVIGSSYGWLITADERSELHLLNPITGQQIALPSVTTIEQVEPVFDGAGAIQKYEYSWYDGKKVYYEPPSTLALDELRGYLYVKAFLSSDPSAGDYIVVLIHNPWSQLSFARSSAKRWTWLPPHSYFEEYCVIKDGSLYALSKKGEIQAFDLNGPEVTCKVVIENVQDYMDYGMSMYVVQAPCGDLLQIWRICDPLGEYGGEDEEDEDEDVSEPEPDSGSVVVNTTMIKPYKVDTAAKILVEVSNLGDNMLFLGHNQSLCLHAEEYPLLKANHVYLTDDHEPWNSSFKDRTRDVGVFSLENNIREEIVSPVLWSNWPPPVWITPNPRKINFVSDKRI